MSKKIENDNVQKQDRHGPLGSDGSDCALRATGVRVGNDGRSRRSTCRRDGFRTNGIYWEPERSLGHGRYCYGERNYSIAKRCVDRPRSDTARAESRSGEPEQPGPAADNGGALQNERRLHGLLALNQSCTVAGPTPSEWMTTGRDLSPPPDRRWSPLCCRPSGSPRNSSPPRRS